jgi:predicted ABC-type transport system involved in lysophospholipase L1 biosynthesis ATPase subunit
VRLGNEPALLLVGEAGMGKSHLLAATVQNYRRQDLVSVLILGQHLTTMDDPWTQIIRLLHIACDRDTFLGVLNTYGETQRVRVLLCIDAINEGQGRRVWEDHLAAFLTIIARYPWIGLVLSIQSSYEKLIVPDPIKQ